MAPWLLIVGLALGCRGGSAPEGAAARSPAPLASTRPGPGADGTDQRVAATFGANAETPRLTETQASWRFALGSPVAAAPVVAAEGHVHVVTADGTVTALGPDGRLRWSHGLGASVQVAPAVSGRITYVGTADGRLVALKWNGQKLWSYPVRTGVVSGLVVASDGSLRLAGSDGSVHAVTARGGAVWRVALGEAVSAGPSLGPDDSVVVGTIAGRVVWIDSFGRRRSFEVGAPIRQQVWHGDGRVYAVAGSDLVAVDDDGAIRWRVPRVRVLAVASARVLAAESRGRLSWWSGAGRLEETVELGQQPSDVPAVAADGTVYVPTETGEVLVVRDGRVVGRVVVGRAAVLRPCLDPRRRLLVAVAGDGAVVGVKVPSG